MNESASRYSHSFKSSHISGQDVANIQINKGSVIT
jgi:hypothetical protein